MSISHDMNLIPTPAPAVEQLRKTLAVRFPGAQVMDSLWGPAGFSTGSTELDALFPGQTLPYGQIFELTGGESSGKTTVALRMLRAFHEQGFAWLDCPRTFFPLSAASVGLDLTALIVARPGSSVEGLRCAELLFQQKLAGGVVLDLSGDSGRTPLPLTLMHRLRIQTVRSHGVLILLTEPERRLLPASSSSLKLEIVRIAENRARVTVARSRLSAEGIQTEISLHA